jgi:phage tail sheath protein FI
MAQAYTSPGVYRQEVFLKPAPALQTGVPGFVGFASPTPGGMSQVNRPVALSRKEDFSAAFNGADGSFLADAIAGFFENGGTRCFVVAADSSVDPAQGLVDAIAALAPLDDIDLLAVPDATSLRTAGDHLDKTSIALVQAEMLTHCAQLGTRFAILDSLPGASVDDVLDQGQQLLLGRQEPVNAALYYPWLLTSNQTVSAPLTSNKPAPVPPCGHIAGIYRRSDVKTGVFKAPANEEIFGVLDLETQIDNSIQGRLNPARVNCLRAFPGRGIRVWGARTVGSACVPPDHDDWLYVNVRRLFLTVRRWIDFNMGWAAFEPNDSRLWVRILRELTVFLNNLQRDGALRGATAAEAFYVKCDAENNPPELREQGQVMIEIGLAPLSPAEFIVVRIVRRAGGSPDN